MDPSSAELFEYRVGGRWSKRAEPDYGSTRLGSMWVHETYQTLKEAQIKADRLQPLFEEVWLERRPVGSWEPVP
ncbi:MAG TPA: hypothetical protein VE645_18980 [Pseudonocardiaceae bacterium]|jgi:hypothetical protein|nr:hypothetical protein [Pseudonocardiaceae bacterium]